MSASHTHIGTMFQHCHKPCMQHMCMLLSLRKSVQDMQQIQKPCARAGTMAVQTGSFSMLIMLMTATMGIYAIQGPAWSKLLQVGSSKRGCCLPYKGALYMGPSACGRACFQASRHT